MVSDHGIPPNVKDSDPDSEKKYTQRENLDKNTPSGTRTYAGIRANILSADPNPEPGDLEQAPNR